MTPADFFYNEGEKINELLKLFLGEGDKDVSNENEQAIETVLDSKESISFETIRMYKIIVSIQILREERMCSIGKRISKYPKKQEENPKYTQLCAKLKKEIDILDPSTANRVFYEKVNAEQKDSLYFQEYIRKEINALNFLDDFLEFCENCGITHKKQIA